MSFSFDDDIQLAQRLTQEELPPEIEEEARAALDRLLQATANSLWDGKPNTRPAIATLLTSLGGLFNPAGVPAREKRLYSRTVDFRYTTRGSKKSYATLTRHIDIAMRMHELREEKGAAGKVADEFGLKDETEVYRILQDPTVVWLAAMVRAAGSKSDERIGFVLKPIAD